MLVWHFWPISCLRISLWLFSNLDSREPHHGYLVVGGSSAAKDFLFDFWHRRGVNLKGSPDYFDLSEPFFGIDEARRLVDKAIQKAFTGQKVFLISPEKITVEAQNALLKTFEEPIADTHFFLAVREEALIIPTLRSRMVTWRLNRQVAVQPLEGGKFLSMSLKDRLNFAKNFEDNLSEFLDQLLLVRRDEKIFKMRLLANDRAASVRLILEHLSLVL